MLHTSLRLMFCAISLAVLLVAKSFATDGYVIDSFQAMTSVSRQQSKAKSARQIDTDLPRATSLPAAQAVETVQARFERFWALLPRVTLLSVPSQRVVVVEFIDYLCASCWRTRAALDQVLEGFRRSHPGQVTVISKDYPLDQSCNPELRRQVHAEACDAAVLVRIAKRVGKGREIETWLRTLTLNQASAGSNEVQPPALRQNSNRFLRSSDVDRFFAAELALVRADVVEARALGVAGTPTLFVNGRHSDSLTNPGVFEMAVNYELADKGRVR